MFKFIEKQFRKPSGLLGKYIVKKMKELNHPIYDKLIASLGIQNYDKIFEIGYGHGIGIDKILCLNVVYFWDDLELPFKKIFKGLKKEGILALFMDGPDDLTRQKLKNTAIFNKHTIEQVVEKLKESGFNSIDYSYDHGYYVICKK